MFQTPPQEHSTVAMELPPGYEPLCFSQKDGLPQPLFNSQTLPPSTLHRSNPQPPLCTPSSGKPEPLPAFTPPVWLLYLCRTLDTEASATYKSTSNSPRRAFAASIRRKANSPSIPPLHKKHRKHFHSIAPRQTSPTSEMSTESSFK